MTLMRWMFRPNAPVAWLSLITLGVALYLPSLRFTSFHYDDLNVVVENPAVHSLRAPGRFFTDPTTGLGSSVSPGSGDVGYRPLLTLSFAVDYALWGTDGRGYRAVNLIIHVATALIVFGLGQRLGFASLIAWLAAVAMLIHPVHVQIVDYISARSSGLSGALILAATWAYATFRRGGSRWSYPLALGLALGALLTKESAAVLPVLLLLTEVAEPGRGWRSVSWRSLAPFVLFVLVFFWVRFVVMNPSDGTGPPPDRSNLLAVIWTALRLLTAYAQLWVFPWPLALDHPFPVTEPSWDWQLVQVSIFLFGGIASIVWGLVSRFRMPALGPLWFAVTLVPASVLPWMTTRALLFEHRAYAADCGLALLTAWVLVGLLERSSGAIRGAVIAATVAIGLGWSAATIIYAETWRTPLTAWRHAVRVSPDSMTAQYGLGVHLRALGRDDEALAAFERARTLNPTLKEIETQIEAIRLGRGEWFHVIAENEALVHEDPSKEFAWFNLGVAYQKIGARDQALDAYRKAIALRPSRAASFTNSGAILLETGRITEAVSAFHQALVLEPSSIGARYNLAAAYREMGRREDARREYQALLDLLPAAESGEGIRASIEMALREMDADRP